MKLYHCFFNPACVFPQFLYMWNILLYKDYYNKGVKKFDTKNSVKQRDFRGKTPPLKTGNFPLSGIRKFYMRR